MSALSPPLRRRNKRLRHKRNRERRFQVAARSHWLKLKKAGRLPKVKAQ